MSKTTYTATFRSRDCFSIVWHCGHKHRTLAAACRCLFRHDVPFAIIESTDGHAFYHDASEVDLLDAATGRSERIAFDKRTSIQKLTEGDAKS